MTPSRPGRPDGDSIAFTSSRERDRDLSTLNDVWLVPSTAGAPDASPDTRARSAHLCSRPTVVRSRSSATKRARPTARGRTSWSFRLRGANRGRSWLAWTRRSATWRSPTRATPSRRSQARWLPDGSGLLATISAFGRVSVVAVRRSRQEEARTVDRRRARGRRRSAPRAMVAASRARCPIRSRPTRSSRSRTAASANCPTTTPNGSNRSRCPGRGIQRHEQ